jgi:hypothetical protein
MTGDGGRRQLQRSASVIRDLLFPATDAGVLAQVIGVLVTTVVVLVLVRRERSLVTLTIGIALVVLGFFGFRALH